MYCITCKEFVGVEQSKDSKDVLEILKTCPKCNGPLYHQGTAIVRAALRRDIVLGRKSDQNMSGQNIDDVRAAITKIVAAGQSGTNSPLIISMSARSDKHTTVVAVSWVGFDGNPRLEMGYSRCHSKEKYNRATGEILALLSILERRLS